MSSVAITDFVRSDLDLSVAEVASDLDVERKAITDFVRSDLDLGNEVASDLDVERKASLTSSVLILIFQ